jgi:hypothetical protein
MGGSGGSSSSSASSAGMGGDSSATGSSAASGVGSMDSIVYKSNFLREVSEELSRQGVLEKVGTA